MTPHDFVPHSGTRIDGMPANGTEEAMPWFRKHHICPCGADWWHEWDCLCNDRCPKCNAEIEPDEHEAIEGKDSSKIRALNDRFRRSLTGGHVMLTAAVSELSDELRAQAVERMRTFDAFNADNDPHQEHDFGSFEIDGQMFFFKHDYYDKAMQYGSDDPSDPTKTTRVLTLMLSSDY
jgi:hypothetical protein